MGERIVRENPTLTVIDGGLAGDDVVEIKRVVKESNIQTDSLVLDDTHMKEFNDRVMSRIMDGDLPQYNNQKQDAILKTGEVSLQSKRKWSLRNLFRR